MTTTRRRYPASSELGQLVERGLVDEDVSGVLVADIAGVGSVFTYEAGVQTHGWYGDERGRAFESHEAALLASESERLFREYEGEVPYE